MKKLKLFIMLQVCCSNTWKNTVS